jgi:hypothetical protein
MCCCDVIRLSPPQVLFEEALHVATVSPRSESKQELCMRSTKLFAQNMPSFFVLGFTLSAHVASHLKPLAIIASPYTSHISSFNAHQNRPRDNTGLRNFTIRPTPPRSAAPQISVRVRPSVTVSRRQFPNRSALQLSPRAGTIDKVSQLEVGGCEGPQREEGSTRGTWLPEVWKAKWKTRLGRA